MADLPTRDDILRFIAESPGRVGKREIARAFNISGGDRIELKAMLRDMADDGLIAKAGKRLREPGALPNVAILAISGRNSEGDLTAEPVKWDAEDGEPPKVTIVGRGAPALGDRVLARILKDEAGRPLGKIIKVIERRPATSLAVLSKVDGRVTLEPVSKKEREAPFIEASAARDIPHESLVRIESVRGRSARVVDVIGPVGSEAAVSMLAIIDKGIPHVFPPGVLRAAEVAEPVGLAGREDWRTVPFVTIDPADAKDHDDAVHAAPDPDNTGGHIVSVAIADVAAYVQPGEAMDREALIRGNSTYFPDRVVPMLPERISNNLCSLRENEDRPALAMRMRFGKDGRKTGHTLHRVMMRSHKRLAYQDAQAIADGRAAPRVEDVEAVRPHIDALWAAYACLKLGRDNRAPLELDLPERKILLTPEGKVDRVVVPERLDAHKLIEEFMIQANVAAAETAEAAKVPLLYRVHDAPSVEKLEGLKEFLATLDIKLATGTRLRPEQFNGILERVEGTPHETLVNEVVLRSQAQAEYAPDNLGHFGLNLRRYAHFTSPIRRYADLIVHRALIRAADLGPDGLTDEEMARLAEIGEAISATERRSMVAERETIDRLIAAWLADHVGATFKGRIGGVTKAGLFIRLEGSGADGFTPISLLGAEYFVYDEASHALIGERTGTTYRLGDGVTVRLMEAAPLSGALRFDVVEHEAGPRLRHSRGRVRPGRDNPRRDNPGRRQPGTRQPRRGRR